jgi:hypothetical protein
MAIFESAVGIKQGSELPTRVGWEELLLVRKSGNLKDLRFKVLERETKVAFGVLAGSERGRASMRRLIRPNSTFL